MQNILLEIYSSKGLTKKKYKEKSSLVKISRVLIDTDIFGSFHAFTHR